MNSVRVMATIDGSLYEVEARQIKEHRADFEIAHGGKAIAHLYKINEKWLSDPEDCLMPEEVFSIGKAIDNDLNGQF